jgi:hypothetical protein
MHVSSFFQQSYLFSLEELTYLEMCPESDVKKQLLELGKNVELLACSNITGAWALKNHFTLQRLNYFSRRKNL